MRKVLAVVGSAVFLVIAPGFVAGLAPWWMTHWQVEAPFFGLQVLRWVGALFIALGAIGLLDSFVRFALQGLGTRRPFFQPAIWWLADCIVTSAIQCTWLW
jgi:hypothetical protein